MAGDQDCGGCRPDGLRERKKQATRQALSRAAMRLAIEHGLDNVVVDDIAAQAGVSPRTFSNYFASKHEAICALAMERGRRIAAALRARPAAEPLMAAITHAVLEPYEGRDQSPDRDWVASVRLVVRSPALQGEYLRAHYGTQQALTQAIAERVGVDPADDMFPAVLAGAVTAATHVAMDRWLRTDPPTALGPLIRQALAELGRLAEPRYHADG
ncbi:MAG: acyl-CoA-like ligand-binding transcription factor [Streptosporangiaceae bacterium]